MECVDQAFCDQLQTELLICHPFRQLNSAFTGGGSLGKKLELPEACEFQGQLHICSTLMISGVIVI